MQQNACYKFCTFFFGTPHVLVHSLPQDERILLSNDIVDVIPDTEVSQGSTPAVGSG